MGASAEYQFGNKNNYNFLGLSSFYADYTFKLGNSWNLQTGLGGAQNFIYLTAVAKYKEKLWFGVNGSGYAQNLVLGYNFKSGISLGASVGSNGFYKSNYYPIGITGSVFLKADLHKLFGR